MEKEAEEDDDDKRESEATRLMATHFNGYMRRPLSMPGV